MCNRRFQTRPAAGSALPDDSRRDRLRGIGRGDGLISPAIGPHCAARFQPDRDHPRGRADRRHRRLRRHPHPRRRRPRARSTLPRRRCRRWPRRSSSSTWTPAACPVRWTTWSPQPGNATGWLGPYAKTAELKDPWNHPFEYTRARRRPGVRPGQPGQGRQARRHQRRCGHQVPVSDERARLPRARPVRGFTLLEIILVIAIIAAASVLAATAMSGGFRGMQLQGQRAARSRRNLRYTRAQAIATGEPQRFVIDPARHVWRRRRTHHGDDARRKLGIEFTGAREVAVRHTVGAGRDPVFPDGAATGGRIRLTRRQGVLEHRRRLADRPGAGESARRCVSRACRRRDVRCGTCRLQPHAATR